MMTMLTQSPEWHALETHRDVMVQKHLYDLFAADEKKSNRFDCFSLRCGGLLYDFSKQRLTSETLSLLCQLAKARDVAGAIQRMARGETVNFTENHAALHMALRMDNADGDCKGIKEAREAKSAKAAHFVHAIRNGHIKGATGRLIRNIVNLGIGGSDLGPRFALQALSAWVTSGLTFRFVANIDPADFSEGIAGLNPEETLFIISSKRFSTQETLANAAAARAWLKLHGIAANKISQHFVAVTSNEKAAYAWGIRPEHCFALPEEVGGRFSVWSAIGLPLACAIGMEHFEAFLAGGREMDHHFLSAPLEQNMPILMALVGIWNINFLGADSLAILPYAYALRLLPSYLQQLEMESNGKHINQNGEALDYATAPVVWGEAGTRGQHTFYQLLHQGSCKLAIDFIVPVLDSSPAGCALIANALGQSAALMHGQNKEQAVQFLLHEGYSDADARQIAPHLVCKGDQVSSMIVLSELSPRSLGQLIALYEHKVVVQGFIWGINSFDQWGVELGKQVAREILPALLSKGTCPGSPSLLDAHLDVSTAGLVRYVTSCLSACRSTSTKA